MCDLGNPINMNSEAVKSKAAPFGRVSAMALLIFLTGAPVSALTINTTFDTSITSRTNALQIENAFNAVANVFNTNLSSPVTVNIKVSWGNVAGRSLGSNIGASVVGAYNGYAYSDVQSALAASAALNPQDTVFAAAIATLPVNDPTNGAEFYMPASQAKALGLVPGDVTGIDSYIGFANTNWDYNTADGVAKGAYQFEALAYHEIDEALGRITGIFATTPPYFTPIDLFRYSARGVTSRSFTGPAYFSLDGGLTNLGTFNNIGGGDRSDWLSSTGADAQNAYFTTGKAYTFGTKDWLVLAALGWNQTNSALFYGATNSPLGQQLSLGGSNVPETSSWAFMALGIGLLGAGLRNRQRAV